MPLPTKPTLDARVEAKKYEAMYNEAEKTGKFHGLILGEKGSGKTSLLRTCPKPIFIHSFDPGGTSILYDMIQAGDVIADVRFEEDDPQQPTAYMLWQTEFNRLRRGGFFSSIGTYCLDSTSSFADAVVRQILAKDGRKLPPMNMKLSQEDQGMRQVDWGQLASLMVVVTNKITSLPCHTVMLGHIARKKNDVTGGVEIAFAIPGSSRENVPRNISEFYFLQVDNDGTRSLLTGYEGMWKASTRIGGIYQPTERRFDLHEKTDIRYLLKKAGLDYEDRPSLTNTNDDTTQGN